MGATKARGSRPARPTTAALVFAEPNPEEVSVQRAANLAAWCASNGIQYIYLYDPPGQLKSSAAFLMDRIRCHPAVEGLSFGLASGWPGLQRLAGKQQQQRQRTGTGTAAAAAAAAAAAMDVAYAGSKVSSLAVGLRQAQTDAANKGRQGQRSEDTFSGSDQGPKQEQQQQQQQQEEEKEKEEQQQQQQQQQQEEEQQQQKQKQQRDEEEEEQQQEHGHAAARLQHDQRSNRKQRRIAAKQRQQQQQQKGSAGTQQKGADTAAQPDQLAAPGKRAGEPRSAANGCHAASSCACGNSSGNGSAPLSAAEDSDSAAAAEKATASAAAAAVVTVHLLSAEDGPAPAIAAALQGARTSCGTHAAPSSGCCCAGGPPDPAHAVYAELAAVAGPEALREPQLLLVLGPALTLAGYPPFHTRAAQIYHLGPSRGAGEAAVRAALARYTGALQRHGA